MVTVQSLQPQNIIFLAEDVKISREDEKSCLNCQEIYQGVQDLEAPKQCHSQDLGIPCERCVKDFAKKYQNAVHVKDRLARLTRFSNLCRKC